MLRLNKKICKKVFILFCYFFFSFLQKVVFFSRFGYFSNFVNRMLLLFIFHKNKKVFISTVEFDGFFHFKFHKRNTFKFTVYFHKNKKNKILFRFLLEFDINTSNLISEINQPFTFTATAHVAVLPR